MRSIAYFPLVVFILIIFAILCARHANADVGSTALKSKFIVVLVIDTGVDVKHPMLNNRAIKCPHQNDCADFWGHGTHVTSLIVNGELNARNQPTARVCDRVIIHSCDYKSSTGYSAGLKECLSYLAWLKPDFVNFSSTGESFSQEEYDTYAALPNTIFVVAAGNEGNDLTETPGFPAIFPAISKIAPKLGVPNLLNVITVGARTTDGGKWVKSNYASFVKFEKGVNVNSAMPNGQYGLLSGTSQATALHTNKLLRERCDGL